MFSCPNRRDVTVQTAPTNPPVRSLMVALFGLLLAIAVGRELAHLVGGGVGATTLGVLAGCGAGFAVYRVLHDSRY